MSVIYFAPEELATVVAVASSFYPPHDAAWLRCAAVYARGLALVSEANVNAYRCSYAKHHPDARDVKPATVADLVALARGMAVSPGLRNRAAGCLALLPYNCIAQNGNDYLRGMAAKQLAEIACRVISELRVGEP